MAAVNVTTGEDRRSPATSTATLIDRASSDIASPDLAASETAGLEPLTRYPGGKNGAGIYQRLISLIPPHLVYVEAFLGSGAILRRKRPAKINIGIDVDAGVIARHGAEGPRPGFQYVTADAVEWLADYFRPTAGNGREARTAFVYCDPPYMGRTRCRPARDIYRHELLSVEAHERLLRILTSIPAMVMISGYRCRLYDRHLADWTRVDYQAMTRGGLKPEAVWFNYPTPTQLHDYRFLGEDYHDRCRIARKLQRWKRRLAALPALERSALIDGLGVAAGGNKTL